MSFGISNLLAYENNVLLALFIFVCILVVYNLQRIYKLSIQKSDSPWLKWVSNHREGIYMLIGGAFVSALLLFVSLFELTFQALSCISGFSFISLWYVYPVFGKSLREIPFLKAPAVAAVWTFMLLILPSIDKKGLTSIDFTLYASFFFYFLALTIPFDIRDLSLDKKTQKTIPQLVGTKIAIVLSLALLLIFYIYFAYFNIYLRLNVIYWFSLLLTSTLILGMQKNRSENYLALIDLSMGLLGLSLFLAHI